MSKLLANGVTRTDADVDEIAAALLNEGFSCAEIGRGGFLPILVNDEDADLVLGQGLSDTLG